jgi:hypothetical protein
VRIAIRCLLGGILATSAAAVCAAGAAAQEQGGEVLMPEQSAAKARAILLGAVDALGGNAYLTMHDVTCTGTFSNFGHSGELNGFTKFQDFEIPPDKDRFENVPKHNIIQITSGDKGWTLDRGGVSEEAATDLADNVEGRKTDLDNILRHRMNEKDMVLRYVGPDTVDRLEVDWVELTDPDNRIIRIAISKSSHLPIRKTVETRNPNTQMKSEEVEYYSNFHPIQGIQTAYQITRDRNGLKVYQVFFDKCEYNTNLADSFFTKQALDERWEKVGKKSKYKSKSASKADKDDKDTNDKD